MASQSYEQPTGADGGTARAERETTGWVGWIIFASVLMILAGIMNATQGLIAVINDEWVVWGNRADLYLDLSAWGWVHLVVGIVLFLAGVGVLSGNVLARSVAVVVAGVSIVANFLFIPAYPVWALTVIAIDVFVIYALTAHGGELRR
jgi:hypothetical protein